MIASKEAVWENEKPKYVKKPNLPEVTKSYHEYMVNVRWLTFDIKLMNFLFICIIVSISSSALFKIFSRQSSKSPMDHMMKKRPKHYLMSVTNFLMVFIG